MTATFDTPTASAVQLSRFAPFLAFLVVSLAVATPIVMHSALPSVDLPNHIARYAIMAHPNGPLGEYYSVPDFAPVPNSAADLLWRWSGMQGDPVRFANTIFATYAVNLVASVMVLSRVLLGRWTVWPAMSGFLVYNAAFFWGFQNYLFSVPFAIMGFALWISTARWSSVLRLLIFLPLATGLYLMHLFAFVALALLAFGWELQEILEAESDKRSQFVRRVPMAMPFLLPIVWMFTRPISEQGAETGFGGPGLRLEALVSPASTSLLAEVPWMNSLGQIGLGLLFICFLTTFMRSGGRLVADRRILAPFLVLLVAASLAPGWLNGVAFVHIRLPFVVLAVLIAATSWHDLSARQGTVLIMVFAALIGVRSLQFERYAATNDAEIRDLNTVLQDLPLGSRLLPLRAPGQEGRNRLWHAQAYAVISRQSFVPTLFQGVHALHVRQRWLEATHPASFAIDIRRLLVRPSSRPRSRGVYWNDWENTFTHALVVDNFDAALITDQPLKVMQQSGRFTLLEIEKH